MGAHQAVGNVNASLCNVISGRVQTGKLGVPDIVQFAIAALGQCRQASELCGFVRQLKLKTHLMDTLWNQPWRYRNI